LEQRGLVAIEALEPLGGVGEALAPFPDGQAREQGGPEREEQSELGARVEHGATVPCRSGRA